MMWLLCSVRQEHQRSASLTVFVLLFVVLFLGEAMASSDLVKDLGEMQANSIVLMITPYPTRTRVNVTEVTLPEISCVYELHPGPSFDEILELLGELVTEHDRPKRELDLRVGIIFKREGRALRDFYFEDRGGSYNVDGFSRAREISARGDLPERLRAIARHLDVTLLKDKNSRCPRT